MPAYDRAYREQRVPSSRRADGTVATWAARRRSLLARRAPGTLNPNLRRRRARAASIMDTNEWEPVEIAPAALRPAGSRRSGLGRRAAIPRGNLRAASTVACDDRADIMLGHYAVEREYSAK